MKCYEGHILTVNQNTTLPVISWKTGEKSYTWETTCPEQYRSDEVIQTG